MKKLLAAVLSIAFLVTFSPALSPAATTCTDVESAKSMLKKQTATTSEIQAPRLAGARSQDIQAPRTQDVQAPRGQDVQAPRGQDVQAPRTQEIQAPRGQQDIQAPRVKKAGDLVRQAEAACNQGDMTLAAKKAQEALALLRK
jgi:hypothetical protein